MTDHFTGGHPIQAVGDPGIEHAGNDESVLCSRQGRNVVGLLVVRQQHSADVSEIQITVNDTKIEHFDGIATRVVDDMMAVDAK